MLHLHCWRLTTSVRSAPHLLLLVFPLSRHFSIQYDPSHEVGQRGAPKTTGEESDVALGGTIRKRRGCPRDLVVGTGDLAIHGRPPLAPSPHGGKLTGTMTVDQSHPSSVNCSSPAPIISPFSAGDNANVQTGGTTNNINTNMDKNVLDTLIGSAMKAGEAEAENKLLQRQNSELKERVEEEAHRNNLLAAEHNVASTKNAVLKQDNANLVSKIAEKDDVGGALRRIEATTDQIRDVQQDHVGETKLAADDMSNLRNDIKAVMSRTGKNVGEGESGSPAMHSPLRNKDLDRRCAETERVGSIEAILSPEMLANIQEDVNLASIVALVVEKGEIVPILESFFRGGAIGGIGELQLDVGFVFVFLGSPLVHGIGFITSNNNPHAVRSNEFI